MWTFKLTPDDGASVEVKANTRDVWRWERQTKGRTMGQLMSDMSLVDLYKIAHIAATREQVVDCPLSEFTESYDLTIVGEDEEPDPTPRAR